MPNSITVNIPTPSHNMQRLKSSHLDVPMNEVRFNGSFTFSELHNYMQELVADVPVTQEEEIKYSFVSALIGSTLTCAYEKGNSVFTSDSISTILIVKDFLTNCFNQRGTQVSVNWNVNDQSIPHMI